MMEGSSASGMPLRRSLIERISFRGHPMVLALHPTTIEVTREEHLTRRGDCIIGVGANKGCADLEEETKRVLTTACSRVRMRLVVGVDRFEFVARGDPRLTLTHPHDIVIRRSDYASDRTLAVGSNAAAVDIPRRMVASLRRESTIGYLEVGVTNFG